jgi:ABC-type sugar transport system substrate-binding protein
MDNPNNLDKYFQMLGAEGEELSDGKAPAMPRRDFLRLGALAAGGAAFATTMGRLPFASATGTVHGYFGTFKNLSGMRYGWPSLEHDPINDSLWTAQIQTAKVDHTGIKFANVDANDSQAVQVQNALDFIGQGYNGVYINTGTPAGWASVIKQGNSSHCATMNHSPDPFTGATQNVVIDHAYAGYINAQAAAKWLKANRITHGAAVTLAVLNSVPLKLRTDTFKSELKKLVPGVTIYSDVAVPLNEATAAVAAAENVMTAHPDLNMIFPYNDETSVPVAKALAEEGHSDPTKLWLGGVDGSTLALQAIATGKSTLQATAAFLFNYSAAYLMKDLETWLSGGHIYPTRALLPLLATKSNAGEVLAQNNGFLLPKYRPLYTQLMHYFSTPLVTGGPLPTVVTKV